MDPQLNQSKLILIEGIPGSGKTTLSKRLHESLTGAGYASRLHQEGDADHPVDLAFHAYFSPEEFAAFGRQYPDITPSLVDTAIVEDAWVLVPYKDGERDLYEGRLLEELKRREFCFGETPAVSMADFKRVFARRWERLVQSAFTGVMVMESAFLQHPIHDLLRLYEPSTEQIVDWLGGIAAKIASLAPVLFYIAQRDVAESLGRTARMRGRPRFATDEAIAFWTKRKAIEFAAIASMPIRSYVVDNSLYDWDGVLRVMQAALGMPEDPFA